MTPFAEFAGLETAESGVVRRTQERLLREQLEHAGRSSPFYREVFAKHRIDPSRSGTPGLRDIPFTTKRDLEERNDDFLAVPMERISDIVLSSGTTGHPTRMMYSQADLERLAYNERVAFERIGVNAGDIVLLTCTMDRCFVAGLAYYSGVKALGAATVRNGLGSVASHMEIIKRMNPTVVVGVPSFLFKLGSFLSDQGLLPGRGSVRRLVGIGEPTRDRDLNLLSLGRRLEETWGAKVYSTYALSETVTTFCECAAQRGGHLHPALGLVEIVDESGNVLPPGEVGEIVITPFLVEGMPVVRFRTGDMSFLITDECACGRRSLRIGPILGRMKQMVKFHGTTLYPPAINAVLDDLKGIGDYYVVVTCDFELSDRVRVHVALRDQSLGAAEIAEKLQARLRVKPEVVVEDEETVRRQVYESSRKPVRFFDRREKAHGRA